MISFGTGTPSACERSLTVTPDSTVTGPVGGATGVFSFGFCSGWSRALPAVLARARGTGVDHDTALAAARRQPWRGRIGRFGLFGRSAIRAQV